MRNLNLIRVVLGKVKFYDEWEDEETISGDGRTFYNHITGNSKEGLCRGTAKERPPNLMKLLREDIASWVMNGV